VSRRESEVSSSGYAGTPIPRHWPRSDLASSDRLAMAAFAKLALEQAECRAHAQEKAAYEAGMAQIVAGGQSIRNPLSVAGQDGRPPSEAVYLSCEEIDVNLVLGLVPIPLTTAMMATEMPAAMRPYSMAVAPDSSRRNA
jgi:hypothetical protein